VGVGPRSERRSGVGPHLRQLVSMSSGVAARFVSALVWRFQERASLGYSIPHGFRLSKVESRFDGFAGQSRLCQIFSQRTRSVLISLAHANVTSSEEEFE
jgi:hypothetical protein